MGTNDSKKRIYDIAKEYNISSDALLKVLRGLGFSIKSHMSVASDDMLEAIEDKFKREIEEVKKGDEARQQKMREIEAKKRRLEAEKAALKRKAETLARKKKKLAEKKAKEKAERQLKKKAAAGVADTDVKGDEEKKKKAKPKKKKTKIKKVTEAVPKKEAARSAEREKEDEPKRAKVFDIVRPKIIEEAPKEDLKRIAAEDEAAEKKKGKRDERRKPKRGEGRLTPGRGETDRIGKSIVSSTYDDKRPRPRRTETKKAVDDVMPPPDRKRRKRDRKKKSKAPKVDQAAVKLSFKQTMANLDGTKKVKRHKRRLAEDEMIDDSQMAVEVTEFMTVSELANVFEVRPAEMIAKLMELGMMASINQRLDMDTIEILAGEYNFNITLAEEVAAVEIEQEDETHKGPRAPVVTIMGHVDHGKTTLLDYIRKSDIAEHEAGKITQHIGAYSVTTPGGSITFLDTPGHEAFSAMRARGAQVTDIVILVVSAVEAVMPQTIEAIDHARAAGVPIIVAINKMDLAGANPDSVRQQLANHNLLSESWGGKTIMVPVSAKSGDGVDKLLEMVLLQAEMMELQADATIKAAGTVIEARLEKGRGTVATVLIQKGTLKVGKPFVAGVFSGRVRAMTDDRGRELEDAGPSTPVQVTGISGTPLAGDSFVVTSDESEAREVSLKRQQIKREYDIRRSDAPTTLESVYAKIKDGQINDLKIIIKGDVAGSVEALSETLGDIGNEEVRVNIIRTGVGGITESDVLLAAASDAIIVGFHVTAEPRARETANREKVDIRTYNIIYEVQDDIKKAIEGMLAPEVSEKWMGAAEVRQTFKVPKVGTICGSYVQQGRIHRGDKIRLSREGVVIHEGTISSLKRFKDDVKEVMAGLECGIGIENYDDIKVGDLIEAYQLVETTRTL